MCITAPGSYFVDIYISLLFCSSYKMSLNNYDINYYADSGHKAAFYGKLKGSQCSEPVKQKC